MFLNRGIKFDTLRGLRYNMLVFMRGLVKINKSEILKKKKQLLLAEVLGMAIVFGSAHGVTKNINNQRDYAFNRLASIESYAPDNVQDDIDELFEIQRNNYDSRVATVFGLEISGIVGLGVTSYYLQKKLDKMEDSEEMKLKLNK